MPYTKTIFYPLCQHETDPLFGRPHTVDMNKHLTLSWNNDLLLKFRAVETHGAVHKVRHAIFDQFLPPPLSHFVTHFGTPLKVRHTSRTPPFLVVQKTRTKAPCSNSILIVRGVFVQGLCPGWFLSIPPSVRIQICYNRKVNITLNFMFHMYD